MRNHEVRKEIRDNVAGSGRNIGRIFHLQIILIYLSSDKTGNSVGTKVTRRSFAALRVKDEIVLELLSAALDFR